MTPEEHSLLERTYNLAEENNKILRSLKRATRISMIFRAVYWVIIIGVSIGAYYFIQPYIDVVMKFLSGDGLGALSAFQALIGPSN